MSQKPKELPEKVVIALCVAADAWEIPAHSLHVDRGVETILLTTAALHKQTREAVFDCSEFLVAAAFGEGPKCNQFPIAAILCERPVTNPVETRQTWMERGLEEALNQVRLNPVLVAYGKMLVKFGRVFLETFELDAPVDGWHFNRLRQPRYLQHAILGPDDNLSQMTFAELVERLPTPKKEFFKASGFRFRPPTRLCATQNLPQRLQSEFGGRLPKAISPKVRTTCLIAIRDAIIHDLETKSIEALGAAKHHYDTRRVAGSGAAARYERLVYPSIVPSDSALGAGEVEVLIFQALRDVDSGQQQLREPAAAVLLSIACWHPVDQLVTLKAKEGWAWSSVGSKRCLGNPDLHEPIGKVFQRRLPPGFDSFLQHARSVSRSAVEDYLQSINPEYTVSRLREALLYVCPNVWSYHPALPQIGFYPHPAKIPAVRTYCRISLPSLATASKWLELFGCDVTPGVATKLPPCGSPNVPKTQELQLFFECTLRLLRSALPHSELNHALCRYNAAVAGLYLFGVVLLGGVRNWPMELPAVAENGTFGYQKGPILWRPSQFLRENLRNYNKRQSELVHAAQREGVEIDQLEVRTRLITLIQLADRCLQPVPFSGTEIAAALSFCDDSCRWAGFYPGGFRHWSMTTL